MIKKIVTIQCRCERCGHVWIPTKVPEDPDNPKPSELPVSCPRCKNPYWNVPRKKKI